MVGSPTPSAQTQLDSLFDDDSSDESRPSKISEPSPDLSTLATVTPSEHLTSTEISTHNVVAFHGSLAEVHAAYQASRKQVVLVVEQFITDIKAFENRFKPTDKRALENAKTKLAHMSKEHERLDKLFTNAQAKVNAYDELQTVLSAYQQHHLTMFNCLGDPTLPSMIRDSYNTQANMKMLLDRIKFEPLAEARDEQWKKLTECVEKMDAQKNLIAELEVQVETHADAKKQLAVDKEIMDGVLNDLNAQGHDKD